MKIKRYHTKRMASISEKLFDMGQLVTNQLNQAFETLIHLKKERVEELLKKDYEINQIEEAIEWEVLHLLKIQQPLEQEIHQYIQLLRAARELERMGDLACNIAEGTLYMKESKIMEQLYTPLKKMVEMIHLMTEKVIAGFCTEDEPLLEEVIHMDDQIDAYFHQNFEDFTKGMATGKFPVYDTSQLLLVLRYLERIADHGVNIAKWKIRQGEVQ